MAFNIKKLFVKPANPYYAGAKANMYGSVSLDDSAIELWARDLVNEVKENGEVLLYPILVKLGDSIIPILRKQNETKGSPRKEYQFYEVARKIIKKAVSVSEGGVVAVGDKAVMSKSTYETLIAERTAVEERGKGYQAQQASRFAPKVEARTKKFIAMTLKAMQKHWLAIETSTMKYTVQDAYGRIDSDGLVEHLNQISRTSLGIPDGYWDCDSVSGYKNYISYASNRTESETVVLDADVLSTEYIKYYQPAETLPSRVQIGMTKQGKLRLGRVELSRESCIALCFVALYNAQKKVSGAKNSETIIPTDPYDYERWIASTLKNLGYEAIVTQGSGDYGVDIVATKSGKKVVVQCKLYSQPVGISAVQEIKSGMGFYDADAAVVVTNATFTPAAGKLAGKLGVALLNDRYIDRIDKMI